jgi:Ni/Co efflux regulator RcnB
MRMLTLVALAASAACAAPAMAQTVPDADYGMPPQPNMPPPAHMRSAPPPGTTWHSNGPPMQMQMRAPMQQQMQQHYMDHRMGPGPGMGGPGMAGGQRHFEFRRIDRGGVVPQRWWGSQFQVRNWRNYGFPQPFAGGRWIRYYDDALLIDGYGRVYDSRPGWDWDRYGDRWSYDDDGVPAYGDGDDYRSGREEYSERYEHRDMGPGPQVRQRVYVQQAPMPMGPPPCTNMCGGGYGYGYGYGSGAVLVTETTVTEAPVVEQRTIVTYETVRVPVRHRRHRVVRCGCRVAAPPVYGGERG